MRALAEDVHAALADRLGGAVVATVVHGSAALGGFVAGHSDIDVLVVLDDRPFPADELLAAAGRLHRTVAVSGVPARELELSAVRAADALEPAPPWPFVLHVATGGTTPRTMPRTVLGGDGAGDRDLLMHYAVCRAAGVAVRGRSPLDVIGPVDRDDVLAYLADELRWALQHGSEAYAVLNAGRALAYLEEDVILSKVDGGAYALGRGLAPEVIGEALAMQRGDAPARPPSPAARVLVEGVVAALGAYGETGR